MVVFLVSALAGFLFSFLAFPVVSSLAGGSGARPIPPVMLFARLTLMALIVGGCIWMANRTFLESETNIRLILGALFGFLVFMQVCPRLSATRSGAEAAGQPGFSEPAQSDLGGPWWSRPRSLLTIALIALPLLALFAPHGELGLGFLRSVKTPFVEAEFSRNEIDLRLDLESEPEGFFQIGRDGLGQALHTARNEAIYQDAVSPGSPAAKAARQAFEFTGRVLQPVAQCAELLNRFYGDRDLVRDHLLAVGAALRRGIALAGTNEPLTTWWRKDFAGVVEALKEDVKSQLTIGDPCEIDISAEREPADLRQALRHPVVAHAASMFFLWSGNPKAALRVLDGHDQSADVDFDPYPGLYHARGFARRWMDGGADPTPYLLEWHRGIELLEQRREKLAPHVVNACPKGRPGVVHFQPPQITGIQKDGERRFKGCLQDNAECHKQLAYGYFTVFAEKIRNHLVYESARNLMTNNEFDDREDILSRARAHGELLREIVETDGLNNNNCLTRQVIDYPPLGSKSDPDVYHITGDHFEHDYGVFMDSYGSILMAAALSDGRVDKDLVEEAIAAFKAALRFAAKTDSLGGLVGTFRDHRAQARRALGLAGE